jgi:[amino group carrier protein]-lysine/ornithine hydrolase
MDLLEDIVRCYSPSTEEREAVECLVRWMASLGLQSEVDAAGNAVGHLGSGAREVLLVGHIDTVPGEIVVRREGEALYGRGTVDAKGPLAAFVVAVARVGALPNLRFTVVGAVEEEAATSKGARYAAEQSRPAFALIGEPSGWERITLAYKGRLLLDYVLEKPMAHTAGEGGGACEEAVGYWQRLVGWAAEYNRERSSRFDTLDPSLRSICSSSDGLSEKVEMHLGLRLPLGLDVTSLLETLQGWRGAAQLCAHAQEQPYRAEKRNALTSAFLAGIRAEGGRAAFVTKTGTSDMNVLGPLWRCPMVAYGPGDSALDHTPVEHIDLQEYLASIRVLEAVLRRLGTLGAATEP